MNTKTWPRSDHLVSLAGAPSWALWRSLVLRGAGFPASLLLDLGHSRASAAASEALNAMERQELARKNALELVKGRLDELRHRGQFETATGRLLVEEQRALCRGKSLGEITDSEAAATIAAWQEATVDSSRKRARFEEVFTTATAEIGRALQRHAANPAFQEAVLWQNRQALLSGVRPMLEAPVSPRNSRRRQREALVANYLQRYCAKNDTIGFFGPSCWGTLEPDGPTLSSEPGAGLLSSRHVYFESWGIETLAESLAKLPGAQRWIAPRLRARLEGRSVEVRAGATQPLSEAEARLLAGCDGHRTALALAEELLAAGYFSNAEEVYGCLEAFQRSGVVSWSFEIPVAPLSEENLRRQLLEIGDEALRREALSRLERLEGLRDDVQAAAQDVDALDRALGALESSFTQLTGASSTRAAGRTYAGRTLVYEDCSRDLKLALGPELVHSLAAPLELLLTSARWFLHELANDVEAVLRKLYESLAEKSGSREVDMVAFWYRLMPLLLNQKSVAERALPEFRRRWAQILGARGGESPVVRTSAELRRAVLELFSAPRPAWEMGRYHSPDLMIAADSVEAIREGRYLFVLGEVHLAMNTLNNWVFLAEYPEREQIARWIDLDLAPRVVTMPPKQWPGMTTRCQIAYLSEKDHLIGFWKDPVGVPQPHVLPTSSLIIVDRGDGLVMETRDGKYQFGILEAFGPNLTHSLGGTFDYLESATHTPRVVIDRMVLCRETWRFPAGEIPFATVNDPAERFLQAHAWCREHGIPRFVFVKAPTEQKPMYVDRNSPVLVESLAKAIRGSASMSDPTITLTEMLPNLEQLWLTDAQGNRFTSELRLAVLDQLEESA